MYMLKMSKLLFFIKGTVRCVYKNLGKTKALVTMLCQRLLWFLISTIFYQIFLHTLYWYFGICFLHLSFRLKDLKKNGGSFS